MSARASRRRSPARRRRGRPRSCAAAEASAVTKPVQAAPTSIAPALCAPSAWATQRRAFGVISSGEVVATSTRSSVGGSSPASLERARRRPRRRGRTGARRGARARRSRMPVRRDDPVLVDAEALGDRRVGDDPLGQGRRRGRADGGVAEGGAQAWSASGGRRATPRRLLEDAADEPGQHLAGAGLDEAARAGVAQREQRLAPAHAVRISARGELGRGRRSNGAAVRPQKTGKRGRSTLDLGPARRGTARTAGSIGASGSAPRRPAGAWPCSPRGRPPRRRRRARRARPRARPGRGRCRWRR